MCQLGARIMEVINQQADWDPDTIFGTKVPQCNLEAIFTDSLYRQASKNRPARKRGSSQDWKKDRLTKPEVNHYKTRMGHNKCWDEEGAAKKCVGTVQPAAQEEKS